MGTTPEFLQGQPRYKLQSPVNGVHHKGSQIKETVHIAQALAS